MKKQNFVITGMTCSACSSRVEKCVSAIDGTSDVSVNLLTNSMRLAFDENLTSEDDIIQKMCIRDRDHHHKNPKICIFRELIDRVYIRVQMSFVRL